VGNAARRVNEKGLSGEEKTTPAEVADRLTHDFKTVREFYPDGSVKLELPLRDGKRHGKVIKRYKSGGKALEREYRRGEALPGMTRWYASGEKKEERSEVLVNGRWHLKVTDYYRNGYKKSERVLSAFRERKCSGTMTWWYENGQKKMEGEIIRDRQDGEWRRWSETGECSVSQWSEGRKMFERKLTKWDVMVDRRCRSG